MLYAKQIECFAHRAFCPNVDFNSMKETIMNVTFNRDIVAGTWTQVRGKVKETWGKLTDNDLDRIRGQSIKDIYPLINLLIHADDLALQVADSIQVILTLPASSMAVCGWMVWEIVRKVFMSCR